MKKKTAHTQIHKLMSLSYREREREILIYYAFYLVGFAAIFSGDINKEPIAILKTTSKLGSLLHFNM